MCVLWDAMCCCSGAVGVGCDDEVVVCAGSEERWGDGVKLRAGGVRDENSRRTCGAPAQLRRPTKKILLAGTGALRSARTRLDLHVRSNSANSCSSRHSWLRASSPSSTRCYGTPSRCSAHHKDPPVCRLLAFGEATEWMQLSGKWHTTLTLTELELGSQYHKMKSRSMRLGEELGMGKRKSEE